jgi:hypothetical protein
MMHGRSLHQGRKEQALSCLASLERASPGLCAHNFKCKRKLGVSRTRQGLYTQPITDEPWLAHLTYQSGQMSSGQVRQVMCSNPHTHLMPSTSGGLSSQHGEYNPRSEPSIWPFTCDHEIHLASLLATGNRGDTGTIRSEQSPFETADGTA